MYNCDLKKGRQVKIDFSVAVGRAIRTFEFDFGMVGYWGEIGTLENWGGGC